MQSLMLILAATAAIDLQQPVVRATLPGRSEVSHSVGPADGGWAFGEWAYRYHITKPWSEELPEWPCVDLPTPVADWTSYDRLVIDVLNDAPGGDILGIYIATLKGKTQHGYYPPSLALPDFDYRRWTIHLDKWPKTMDPKNVGRLHFFTTRPVCANVYLCGFHLLKLGEEPPPVLDSFMKLRVEPARAEATRRAADLHRNAMGDFIAKCRAAGQTGEDAWFGKASSMIQVRPRAEVDEHVNAADEFAISAARGEYASFQVVVTPNGRELKDCRVEVVELARELPRSAFKASPVGYVKTVNAPPYKFGYNVATNLPGGYFRTTRLTGTGWWADPILDWLDRADVTGEDLQSFWVRFKCPDDAPAGTYRGKVAVTWQGGRREFPLSVRVYGFSLPKTTQLPLAITFSPAINYHRATPEQLRETKPYVKDPESPINAWKRHETEWTDFLADYFITIDSLYHKGDQVRWDDLLRLREQGRLGLFNLGYWRYPKELSEKGRKEWHASVKKWIEPSYLKAKELGLLGRAYLYGCDEVLPEYFENIKWATTELKKLFPGVPIFTTAVDEQLGVGNALSGIDWFTPTTTRMLTRIGLEQVEKSRAEGHKVWWYIACNQRAPYANPFVESNPLELRMLMGAQTAKYRPDGFLYYHTTMWNTRRPISGASTFTDWNPRSYVNYHGDGSWFCCGPDGIPCATMRIENFRDGLEDYAMARLYEKATGCKCEVPDEVCRAIDQFTDDPEVIERWRNRLAEAIESHGEYLWKGKNK